MKTLLIDNYDSFTYNLYQYLAELGANPVIFKNNEISARDVGAGGYTHIVISPGPGNPENSRDFGGCGQVIKKFTGKIPILGVCLGHQGIIYAYGGRIIRAPIPMHGKQSIIRVKNSHKIFAGLPEKIPVMRYHSLIAESSTMPPELKVIAETDDEEKIIMAFAHKTLPVYGVQFHPESIGTPHGKIILKNFLEI